MKMNKFFLMLFAAAGIWFSGGAQEEKSVSAKNMVFIKGGTFQMGSPESENWREKDETLHTVTLYGFYILRYEVTQEEFERVMGKNPSGAENGSARIARGGGWNDFGKHLRCAYRSSQIPDEPSASRGFRVARNAGKGK